MHQPHQAQDAEPVTNTESVKEQGAQEMVQSGLSTTATYQLAHQGQHQMVGSDGEGTGNDDWLDRSVESETEVTERANRTDDSNPSSDDGARTHVEVTNAVLGLTTDDGTTIGDEYDQDQAIIDQGAAVPAAVHAAVPAGVKVKV